MNRSFRAPEKGMPAAASVMQRQPQMMGSFRKSVVKEKEEELGLFMEMRKREKERDLLLQNTEAELDSSIGSFGMPAATPARKTGADKFLDSENDKNDYDWLLTPPGTPLFPSLEMESQKTVRAQAATPKVRPTALKSRLSNSQPEAINRNGMISRQQVPSSGLNTSSIGIRRPSSSGGPASRPATPTRRPATPTGRPTLGQSTRPVSSSTKTVSNTTSRSTSTTTSRPSRSSTPTSRPTMGSTKPTLPARSSTPTPRSTARSSTPTSRPSLSVTKPASRASTPTRRQPALTTVTKPSTPLVKSPTLTKPVLNATRTSGGAPPQLANSPSARPRPWKPQEMPGYSLEAPPNLRTSLADRPPSVTRGRPGAPSSRSSSVERVTTGRGRRQSCSPSRGRPPNGVMHNSGSSVPVPALNRAYAKANDNTSPGLYGTKMVERVINMRKLVPPKQDDKHSPHSNLSAKSSPDSSGFGRSLSKKSLDMAIRHMDIRKTVPGNLRPLMTNIPASSMYSVRTGTGPTRSRTLSVSDSPLATSSNASSEMSVNNNGMCFDGNIDDDISSERSVMNIRGRY
ncbi:hypothetical protein Hdeb2414_s0010g00337481 [Helianthus debilis subsp. tardiflorus]